MRSAEVSLHSQETDLRYKELYLAAAKFLKTQPGHTGECEKIVVRIEVRS